MVRVIIAGISVTVFTYVLLAYAQNVQGEAKTATQAYGRMAKAFRGE